ncbi:MAG: hypothetical protein E6G03_04130 [Actinobacteria bacterium]|nr:MAG: hypothetical protein E6G03_04130 [Actinomycetota bacterium]
MELSRKSKYVVGIAALLAAAGGGAAAVAASQDTSPSDESKAIIDDAAGQLGISPDKLGNALKKALADRVDAAVAAGRITKAEGDVLKARIQADDFPIIGGPGRGFGHFGFFDRLDAAASYLGLTAAQLGTELENGKSLAQVAKDHGKSVDGLISALVASAKQKLDQAVAAGRLTNAQETEMLNGLKDRITNLVNSTGLDRPHFRGPGPGFGFRGFDFRRSNGPSA